MSGCFKFLYLTAGTILSRNNREAIGSSLSEVWSNLFSENRSEDAERIADHAWDRHVAGKDPTFTPDLDDLGFEDKGDLADFIDGVIKRGPYEDEWGDGTTPYWDPETETGILVNPEHDGGGTAMRFPGRVHPKTGRWQTGQERFEKFLDRQD